MPKFLVDSTAARLARWLRFLGLDVVLDRSKSTARLLVRARRESRVLLTRRRSLSGAETARALLLDSDHLAEQLQQVVASFEFTVGLLPRCTICNSQLAIVPRVNADGRVPEFIYRSQSEFAFCESCDRYYWQGTHWQNVRSASTLLSLGPPESEE